MGLEICESSLDPKQKHVIKTYLNKSYKKIYKKLISSTELTQIKLDLT